MHLLHKTLIPFGFVLTATALSLAGCEDEAPGGPGNPDIKLLVEGRIEADLDFDASAVTAYEVADDGTRTPIAPESSSVDNSGRFTFSSETELTAGSVVLIEANDAQGDYSVLALVDADGEIVTEPINAETTLESEVFAAVRADGECDDCDLAAVRDAVHAELAAHYDGAGRASADLADIQAVIEAEIEAEATVMRDETRGGGEAAWTAFTEARLEAYVAATVALDQASSMQARAEAEAQYEAALSTGRSTAGVSVELWAEAQHAGAEATHLEAEAATASGDVYAQLIAETEQDRASAVHAAVTAELVANGATMSEVDSTFADLRASIDASRDDGMAAGDATASAWATTTSEITAYLRASLEATAVVAFDAWVSFSETLLATIRTDAISAAAGSSVDAAVEIAAGARDATVDVTALTAVGVDAADAGLFAEILVHTELGATAQ